MTSPVVLSTSTVVTPCTRPTVVVKPVYPPATVFHPVGGVLYPNVVPLNSWRPAAARRLRRRLMRLRRNRRY